MPTAVSLARQCLAPDAAHALDEAVAVARRRGHAQTTSLHAISALLALPSSALRDACARARKTTAYSPRLQFKALELCLSVSLDRVPSTQLSDDPPVSNSLMAAIKRSQANQRRQPENFHLYHQLSHQSSIACVKVELQHFLLSILDDPVVSRVFGEAGFRSSEIKFAIIRPFPQLLRYSSRARVPPLFLCNLMDCPDPNRRGFLLPLSGFHDGDDNENNRRIGEVLGKNRGRNPLLVGVSANVALKGFTEAIEKRNDNFLPEELAGVRNICLENDISSFLSENSEMGSLNMRFVEVVQTVEQSPEPGLIVNFGDLKAFVGDNTSDDRASRVVGQLKTLVDVHGGKVWLIGAASSYETYLRFATKFPSIGKDWDLHLLPITSLRPESYPRSSMMGSFVPLGGFFSTPSDASIPLSGSCQHPSRCLQCDKNCEDEVIAASKGVFTPPVSEQYQSSLPSWMQMTELGNFDAFDAKTRDDGLVLSAKIAGFQNKWDNICQRLHHGQPLKEAPMFPTVVGFQVTEDRREDAAVNNCSSSACVSSHNDSSADLNPRNFMDLPKISLSRSNTFPFSAKGSDKNLLSKLQEETSKTEDLELGGRNSPFSLSISSVDDENRTSSPSAGSVTTDLGLGIVSLPTSYKLKKPLKPNGADFPSDLSGCCSTNVDLVNGRVCNAFTPSSSFSSPERQGQMNAMDVKTLFRLLKERVFWQDQAVSIISQTISQRQTRSDKRHGSNSRGDIWFNFVGSDKFGKRRVALGLAEILYGNKDQFVCVDLSSQDGVINPDMLHLGHSQLRSYHAEFRGKTVLDFVAAELGKQPLSIVMLENVDKAELLDQNRLSQAIQTGKLSDLQGREVSITNAIFMMTSTSRITSLDKQVSSKYSEETLLKAKSWPLRIEVASSFRDQANRSRTVSDTERNSILSPFFMSKRKLNVIDESSDQHEISETTKRSNKTSTSIKYLDLNRPVEENSEHDIDGNCDNDSNSENSKTWLQDFCTYIDQVVVFKPFDFDALAEKIVKDIKKIFHSVFGPECILEIDPKVMEQLLAAAYISFGNREVDDWMEQVLSRKFLELKRIHILSTHSIVKLSTCDQELSSEEKTAEVCLPRRIVLDQKSCCS
ncbi:protein SMAX1-LIKE 7-like [Cucurbita pepo subsp. pepo]|uniref:protein SMAX1-LIKE 7-like n=1 Tax=Cucurbita pepo subsp. pepo TaxID=3664 RepID=UPI000C9D3001|nr:protein SMAX1-LIKE 7-like [Cucurbita pepo subsp. pepo]